MTSRKVEKELRKNGWVLVRVVGSHYQYKNIHYSMTVVIPNHGSKDLSIGVLKNLEKITGLSLR